MPLPSLLLTLTHWRLQLPSNTSKQKALGKGFPGTRETDRKGQGAWPQEMVLLPAAVPRAVGKTPPEACTHRPYVRAKGAGIRAEVKRNEHKREVGSWGYHSGTEEQRKPEMGWSLRPPRTWGAPHPLQSQPQADVSPHTRSLTFLLRGAGSSNKKASGSVSNPLSVWGEPKASPKYFGLAWGWGGEGVEMPLLTLQCPLVVLLPLSDTSPLSFQGSQAAREADGREDKGRSHAVPRQHLLRAHLCLHQIQTNSPSQRP